MIYIVFTNSTGILSLSAELSQQLNGFGQNNKEIAVFSNDGDHVLLDPTETVESDILKKTISVILIKDTLIVENNMQGTIPAIIDELTHKENSIYLIYHNSSSFSYRERHKIGMDACFLPKIKGELESNHIINSPHEKLFKVLLPFNALALESLVNIFPDPILEAKLELLHNCLLPETVPDSLVSLLSDYNADFLAFKTSIREKEFSDKGYLEALTAFREKILPS